MKAIVILVLLSISLVTAISSGWDLLYKLTYALALVLVFSRLWAKLSLQGLEVTVVRRTARAQVGGTIEEEFTIVNHSHWPKLWLEVSDPSDMPGHLSTTIISLSRGRSRTWRVASSCLRRGRFTLGPVFISSGDPLGIFRASRTFGAAHNFLVYPAFADIPGFTLPAADLPGEGRLRRRTYHVTPNAATIRDYIDGDSFNRIHWPSSARLQRLMVKEFELDPASEAWIILDLHHQVHHGDGLENTEEYSISIAASLARRALEANRPVGLIAHGERPDSLKPERGDGQFVKILDILAMAKAASKLPLADVILGEGKNFGRYSALMIVTPALDDTWVKALGQLTQRGVRALTILLDPISFDGSGDLETVIGSLTASSIPFYVVRRGESIAQALSSVGGESPNRRIDLSGTPVTFGARR